MRSSGQLKRCLSPSFRGLAIWVHNRFFFQDASQDYRIVKGGVCPRKGGVTGEALRILAGKIGEH